MSKLSKDAPAPLRTYQRLRDLPRLLPLSPNDIAGDSLAADRHVIALLRRALDREYRRGLEGAWTYDAARYRLLLFAYRTEAARLKRRLAGDRPQR